MDPPTKFPDNRNTPTRATAIAPSDSTDLPKPATKILVGGAGDLSVVTLGGDSVTLTVPAGVLELAVKRVKAAGTTATKLFALS
ncbi:hypothetical protein WK13_34950 [Burkholderia ubonensis]|nr:hypothetical protein WK13_34950 [Burkholderia ubonensis]